VGCKIAAILRSTFKGLAKGTPLLLGKRIQGSCHLQEAESCGITSAQLPAAAGRDVQPEERREQENYRYPKPLQVSSGDLEFSEMWLSCVPLHPYLVATTAKSTREDAAGQSQGFPSNSSWAGVGSDLESFPSRGLSPEKVGN